ncbi:superoxide dismutase family protein [Geodermatophilus sp. SYSU D00079]
MRRPAATSFVLPCVVPLLLAGCSAATGSEDGGGGGGGGGGQELTARLVDAEGTEVGTATLEDADGGVRVSVEVTGLPPGFHGFHLHAVGLCEPDSANPADPATRGDFLSAGGHIGAGEADHGEHAGDLPVLLVDGSGAGTLTVVTDALSTDDLTDDDGSALMVHAGPDNYANVPERYAPAGPDETTRNTGDAGGRIACGPVGD